MEEENKTNQPPETEPKPEEAQKSKVVEEKTEQTEQPETQPEPETVMEPETPETQQEEAKPAAQEAPVAEGEELLLPRDTLLSAGIHIGTRMKTRDMEPFIYRVRPDGLFVLDVKKTDDRIRVAGKFLARYEPSKIAVAATRLYAHEPVKQFCELTGAMPLIGRFIPGMLSNPLYPNRVDPEIIVVSDPRADAQAVKEASAVGRRALAVIFWLMARQVLRERGELPADQNPKATIEDFEAKISREEEEEP
jgi:small subunit ribosomal protein S2